MLYVNEKRYNTKLDSTYVDVIAYPREWSRPYPRITETCVYPIYTPCINLSSKLHSRAML
jgi:hypothetical protein